MSLPDFLSQVLAAIGQLGGLSTLMKLSLLITIVISSMKVSFLDELFWSKLGAFKVWLAPILGLIAGVLSLSMNGQDISWAALFAYMSAGAGAVFLHEILDSVKAIPGLGWVWVKLIDIIEKSLGGGNKLT